MSELAELKYTWTCFTIDITSAYFPFIDIDHTPVTNNWTADKE